MILIKDKEVGELWRALIAYRKAEPRAEYQSDKFIALIHKLVADRAKYHCCEDHFGDCATKDEQRSQIHVNEALFEFGIDPATWPNG